MNNIPAAENCAPLPGRSLLSAELGVVDGHPAIKLTCDCGLWTQHVLDTSDLDQGAGVLEVPLTCAGCGSTRWLKVASGDTTGTTP